MWLVLACKARWAYLEQKESVFASGVVDFKAVGWSCYESLLLAIVFSLVLELVSN